MRHIKHILDKIVIREILVDQLLTSLGEKQGYQDKKGVVTP